MTTAQFLAYTLGVWVIGMLCGGFAIALLSAGKIRMLEWEKENLEEMLKADCPDYLRDKI